MGFFNQVSGIGSALSGGLGQSSMLSQALPTYFEQQLLSQQFQFATVTATTTQTIYPGKVWQSLPQGKPSSIPCSECSNILDFSRNLDGYVRCSCGWKEGTLTSVSWLEKRIEEVTG